jgi:hypothetical protein
MVLFYVVAHSGCAVLETGRRRSARDVHCAIFEILLASLTKIQSWQGFCTSR